MRFSLRTFSVICLSFFIFSACENKPKEEPIKDQPNEPKLLKEIHLTNLPNFENIKPIGIDDVPFFIADSMNIDEMQLNPVTILPEFDASIFDYNLNGTLTAQAPYLNANAFIEVLSGNYLTGENRVDCKCGPNGVTFVKLRMNAKADKIYILTIKAKPKTPPVNITMFSTGVLHTATIDDTNQEFEVLFSSAGSGWIDFWMQCSNPNTGSHPWEFHSIEIQEVDRP